MLKLALQTALFLGLSSSAFAAYFQADFPTASAKSELGTHIIVTGKGMEVGDQWLRAGHTQALLFKDRPQHGAIRFIGAIENTDTLKHLNKWGYTNIQVFDKTFSGSRLVAAITEVAKINSIDFIGHNGALLGFALEDYKNRFFLEDVKAMKALAVRMTADSFVRIMGCNTGWGLAPALAQALQAPVAGSFTFADIEKLHETGAWYYHDEGRYPGGSFLRRNELSYNYPVDCYADGGCMRLKPVRINYQGRHGSYAGTVPFLKFFCGGVSSADCFRRMAISTIYEVSTVAVKEIPTPDQFAEIMIDHFCPSYVNAAKRTDCATAVGNHVRGIKALPSTYSQADGPTLTCNFESCSVVKDCSSGTCVMKGIANAPPSTTFVDELNAFMAGYKLIAR